MPHATLIYELKQHLTSGAIVQVRIWRLPAVSAERPHGLKYSLFYGKSGERIIAYDNETGKGDHRHYGEWEEPYAFTTLVHLMKDFESDVLAAERAASKA